MLSRRSLSLRLGSSLAAMAVLPRATSANARTITSGLADLLPRETKGFLHALGYDGQFHPGAPSHTKDPHCLLTSIDLGARTVRQTPFPMRRGHSALGLGDGRILCMPQEGDRCLVVDPAHALIGSLQAPAGYHFFGHALVKPAGQSTIVLALKRIDFSTTSDHGLLSVYDFETLRLLHSTTSGGLNPHEIVAIPGTDEVCAVHYGHISKPSPPRLRNVQQAKLSVFDGRTLALKREYPQNDIAAALSHLRVDAAKRAYCVLQQYVVIDESIKSQGERLSRYLAYCAEIVGRPVKFAAPPKVTSRVTPVPLPVLRIDTQTGERQVILSSDDHHLEVQSVEVNTLTQTMVSTYTTSNALVVGPPDKAAHALPGNPLRLEEVRGVADIPGTPYVVATSSNHGIVAIDVRDGSMVGHAPIEFFAAAHIYFSQT